MYETMVVLGNFVPGMSSHYCRHWVKQSTLDGTTTNGIMAKDPWTVLGVL